VTEIRGRRHKQLLNDLKEMRGYSKLKEEALDHSVENSLRKWLRTCRKTDYGMNEYMFRSNKVRMCGVRRMSTTSKGKITFSFFPHLIQNIL
jgi:hypothetical protein